MERFIEEILRARGLLSIVHLMVVIHGVNTQLLLKLECNRDGTLMKSQLLWMMEVMYTRHGLVTTRCHGMHIQEIKVILGVPL